MWICLALSTASNLASKTPCTTNLAHLERGIVAPCTSIFLVLPEANSFRRSEQQFSEFLVACTIRSTNSEFSTYLGLIFQHSLEIDLYLSGQISSALVISHNNLSAQLFSAFFEAISATLVDSEVSIYFRHILQHSLELDLFLGGEIRSYLIIIYNNLSAQLISAYLEASPVSLVNSDFRTYCGSNSQHKSEREFCHSGQISVSLSSQYNNNLSAKLISAFLVASSVYLEETEFCKYFVLNFSLRAQINFGPISHICLDPEYSKPPEKLISAFLVAISVCSVDNITQFVSTCFKSSSNIDLVFQTSRLFTFLVANCLLHSEYSVQKPICLNATEMEKNCQESLWSDLKEYSRTSTTDLQTEIDQENARVTKLHKATVQPDDSQLGNQTTMAVDTNVGMLPPSAVGLQFPTAAVSSDGSAMSMSVETVPLSSGAGSTHTDISISLTNIAKQSFTSNFVFISGMPYGLVSDRVMRDALFESIRLDYKIPLANTYDIIESQLMNESPHVLYATNKQSFGIIMKLTTQCTFSSSSDVDTEALVRIIPYQYHIINKNNDKKDTLFHIVIHGIESLEGDTTIGNSNILLYGRGAIGLPIATTKDPSAGRQRLGETEAMLRMQLHNWIHWLNSVAEQLTPGLSRKLFCIAWKDRSSPVPYDRLDGSGTVVPSELMFEVRYSMEDNSISNTHRTELLRHLGIGPSPSNSTATICVGGFSMQLCTDHTRYMAPSLSMAAPQPYSVLKRIAVNHPISQVLKALEADNPGILTHIGSVTLVEACPHPADSEMQKEEATGNSLIVLWTNGYAASSGDTTVAVGNATIQLGRGAGIDGCKYPPKDKWPKWVPVSDLPWMKLFRQRASGELKMTDVARRRKSAHTSNANNGKTAGIPSCTAPPRGRKVSHTGVTGVTSTAYTSSLNSVTTVPIFPAARVTFAKAAQSPPSITLIQPSPQAGAGGNDKDKMYTTIQAISQRLDAAEAENAQTKYEHAQTRKELRQLQQDSANTQMVVSKLQHSVQSVQHQLSGFQIESRSSSRQQLEQTSLLMAYFKIPIIPGNSVADAWEDDDNPQAGIQLNNSSQILAVYNNTHKGQGGVVQRDNMTSSMDHG